MLLKDAVAQAKKAHKNTYIIGEDLNRSNFDMLIQSIHSVPGRVRLCFTGNILAETQAQFATLFSESIDIDALLFVKSVIQNFDALASSLKQCTSLETLSFSRCKMSDQHIDTLVPTLRSLPHLASFEISNDQISPSGFTNICRALASCHELTRLSWAYNQLGDCSVFVDLIKSLPSLRFLDFTGCVLTEPWIKALSELLDASWQIADIQTTVHDPVFLMKVKRNNARYMAMRWSLNNRMARFAQPVNDDDELFHVTNIY